VYEQILRSPGIRHYRSVAWIRNEVYWRDVPGRRSMELNYDLLDRGIQIERTLIVCDFYWPPAAVLPSADILPWIDDQHWHALAIPPDPKAATQFQRNPNRDPKTSEGTKKGLASI
jgi:hypothetical protein